MRILFEPLAGAIGLGAITRCMALAEQAVMRGHTVAFHAQPYPLIENHPLGRRYDAPVPVKPSPGGDPQSSSFNEAIHIRGLADPGYLETAVRAELETIEDFRPDVMVTEWQPTVPISAERGGIPFAATLATTELATLIGEPAAPEYAHVNTNVAHACSTFGVEPADTLEELLHTRSAVNIAPTMPMWEPMLAGVPRTKYVGPVLYPPLELCPTPEVPGHRKAVVYVGAGAVRMTDLVPILGKAFPEPDWGVLVAAREDELDGAPLPVCRGNVVVAHEPGFTAALRGADVVVARGSQNAVAACLLAGVPIVGTPGTRDAEPLFNLRIMQAHGVARTVIGEPTAEAIAEATDALLSDGAAARASQLGAMLRQHGGALDAVRELERVAG